jgi:hypothetical protein
VRFKLSVCSALLLAGAIISVPAWCFKGSSEGQLVDSGAFGVFRQGHRIGTETFSIHQRPDVSVVEAQLKIEEGDDKASQTSELQVASNGDLRHYEWKELSPDKSQATVDYKDEFLVEHVIVTPGSKPQERAFMLPSSTAILDDFFTHREILLWRYLATYCGAAINPQGCKLQVGKFGVFMPRQQASAIVALAYEGKDKVMYHGAQRELDRFTLQPEEGAPWTFWMEASYPFRLLRILVPAENVEVVRD